MLFLVKKHPRIREIDYLCKQISPKLYDFNCAQNRTETE